MPVMKMWRLRRRLRNEPLSVQTRDHEGGLVLYGSVREAFEAAEADPEIWKISWNEGDDRIRLVRLDYKGQPHWLYDPMDRYESAALWDIPGVRDALGLPPSTQP